MTLHAGANSAVQKVLDDLVADGREISVHAAPEVAGGAETLGAKI